MSHYYLTQYVLKNVPYSAFIYAQDRQKAELIAVLRNIGEIVVDQTVQIPRDQQPSPAEHYRERKLARAAHGITFYSWIAAKAGVLSTDGILGDVGVLHEVLHEMEFPEQIGYREGVYQQIKDLEKIVPGLLIA